MKDAKVLTLLSLVQMWKFFSHFGVRILLVLYMVSHLHYSDTRAFGMNAVFCGLVELGSIFGGIIADRYLGLRKSVFIGGWLLVAGYFALFFENSLFWAMGLIIAGSSLFSSNITALLGLAYAEEDAKRKEGFTIFYMMQNLGALVSTIICGFIAMQYGFRWAFVIASSGMVIGNLMLFIYRDLLQTIKEEKPSKNKSLVVPTILMSSILAIGMLSVWFAQRVFLFLPWITVGILVFFAARLLKNIKYPKEQAYKLLIYLGGLILFFAVEDQICSSLLLFAERETTRTLFGWVVPSSLITAIDPIVILLFGAFVAKRCLQIITPFIVTGLSFGILALFCLMNLNCSIFGVIGLVVVISFAELMVGPLVFSYASEIAKKGSPGMVMGMVPIAFSLAFQLSGGLSKMVAIEAHEPSLPVYGTGFGLIALLVLIGGFIMQFLIKRYADKEVSVY